MYTLAILLDYFTKVNGNHQYVKYIRSIDRANGQQTDSWIDSVIKSNGSLSDALKQYDSFFANNPVGWSSKTLNNYRTGFKRFAEVTLGFFSANIWLTRENTSLSLCQLVADNAIFASATVVKEVMDGETGSRNNLKNGNPYASWDRCKHIRRVGVKKGTPIPDHTNLGQTYGDMIADDNTTANHAIKKAVILSFDRVFTSKSISSSYAHHFSNYEACHIWDCPGDRRYYASIANLVLLPRSIAGLSDHSNDVIALLRYEAFRRFKFKPAGEPDPQKPTFYSKITWRYIFK